MQSPYAQRLDELRAKVRDGEARSGRISSWRGVTFLAAVGFGAARAFGPVPVVVWIAAALLAATFLALVIFHAQLVTQGAALEVRVKILERGERRIAGDLAGFAEKGERFLVPGHPYARDLDVFGTASLFQLVCAAETGPGEERVAAWLAEAASAKEIATRQAAVRELVTHDRFREDLAVFGVDSGTRGRGADRFLGWAEAASEKPPNPVLMHLGRALVFVTVAAFVVPRVLGLEGAVSSVWMASFLAQLAILFALRPSLEPVLAPAASREAPFGRYVPLLRLVEAERFEDPRLVALHGSITGASGELAKLETLLNFAEVRSAGLGGVLANAFLLWDVFCAAALERWRARSGRSVRGWIEAIAEIDALAALATFSAEHPDFAFPTVTEGDLQLDAEALGHPLIPDPRRVPNDLTLPGSGTALLITGSNMSGKSTLLRAIGVNAVLAFAGAPVCARRLAIAACQVRTSMRISDSLEDGVSHFYAELERLKSVVDAVDRGERVLFLLDEVLHGTNSRERILGAKAVVKHVLAKGAIGAVTSHDLGLAGLEAESGGRVVNVHLEELVDGAKMTFDYKLKPGVVTSSNALRLMKMIGIGVEVDEKVEGEVES